MRMLRKLGDCEATFAYMHALLAGSTQVTTLLSLDGVIPASEVADALQCLVDDTPTLRMAIVENQGELWFSERAPEHSPDLTSARLAWDETPEDRLRMELNDVLPTGGRLWRMRHAHDLRRGQTHLYWTRNHAISDGHSAARVLSGFLTRLAGHVTPDDPPAPDLPPTCDRLTYRPRDAETLRYRADTIPRGFQAYGTLAPLSERRADFVTLPLTEHDSEAVQAFCKSQGLTVNQLMGGALAKAFSRTRDVAGTAMYTAVSLRGRFIEQPFIADVGCVIGVVASYVPTAQMSLLDVARRYAENFRNDDATWRPPGRGHADIRADVAAMGRSAGFHGICITNLGVLDTIMQPHVSRIRGFRTVVNRVSANYGVVLHLSTLAGRLTASLAFGAPCLTRGEVESIAAALLEEVRSLALSLEDTAGRGSIAACG